MSPTVIYHYDGKKAPISRCVMTLGFFDGVHIAHRELINKGREIADEMGIPLGVFTFPTESGLKPGAKRLYSTEERLEIFKKLGVDFTVVADFASVASFSPEEFVREVLFEKYGCVYAVVGFNFRFGKGAKGDADRLCALMKEIGGECTVCSEMKADGETVCTTLIRSCLEKGEIKKANRLLGEPYRIREGVEHGKGMGRTFGFPTVNTPLDNWRATLRRGVYLTAVRVKGEIYTGVTNVGVCPTFDSREEHAETYIVDFEGDLYGEKTEIYFLDFLRDEMRFDSEKELIMQINVDKMTAIKKMEIENGRNLD